MNAIQMAIGYVKQNIPELILKDCFVNRFYEYRASPITMEERIKRDVIYARILPDCQVLHGGTTYIPIGNVARESLSPTEAVFYIPHELTGGLSIMSVLSVCVMTTTPGVATGQQMMGLLAPNGGSVLGVGVNALLDSHDLVPNTLSARCTLVGENVVLVEGLPVNQHNLHLEVMLANDNQINTLKPRSFKAFNRLVLLAVKAHIYRTMILEIDTARLVGGQDLGAYRSVIERYESAAEEYETYLDEVMGVVFFLNDDRQTARFIKTMIHGYT